eukprot:5605427-Pyramimonas_sp.AAC.2
MLWRSLERKEVYPEVAVRRETVETVAIVPTAQSSANTPKMDVPGPSAARNSVPMRPTSTVSSSDSTGSTMQLGEAGGQSVIW